MKKMEFSNLQSINGGGNGWAYYGAACGVSVAFLEASFLAGPVVFGATAIFASTCALLLPIYGASHK